MWEGMPLHFCGIIPRRCNIISVATLQNAALRLQSFEKTPNTIGESYSNVWLNKRFFVAFRVITGIVNSTYKAKTLNQTRTWKRCSCRWLLCVISFEHGQLSAICHLELTEFNSDDKRAGEHQERSYRSYLSKNKRYSDKLRTAC